MVTVGNIEITFRKQLKCDIWKCHTVNIGDAEIYTQHLRLAWRGYTNKPKHLLCDYLMTRWLRKSRVAGNMRCHGSHMTSLHYVSTVWEPHYHACNGTTVAVPFGVSTRAQWCTVPNCQGQFHTLKSLCYQKDRTDRNSLWYLDWSTYK